MKKISVVCPACEDGMVWLTHQKKEVCPLCKGKRVVLAEPTKPVKEVGMIKTCGNVIVEKKHDIC